MLFDMEQLTKSHWSLIIDRTVLFVTSLFVSWMLYMTIVCCSYAFPLPILRLLLCLLPFTFIHICTCLIYNTRTSHTLTELALLALVRNIHSGTSERICAKRSLNLCIQVSYNARCTVKISTSRFHFSCFLSFFFFCLSLFVSFFATSSQSRQHLCDDFYI